MSLFGARNVSSAATSDWGLTSAGVDAELLEFCREALKLEDKFRRRPIVSWMHLGYRVAKVDKKVQVQVQVETQAGKMRLLLLGVLNCGQEDIRES